MPLTVLSDQNVKDLLQDLTYENVVGLQASLRQALHEYSTGTQDEGCCSLNQPERSSVRSKDGNTSLFMPSTSSSGIGMKVVTLRTPSKDGARPTNADSTPRGALMVMSSNGAPTGLMNAEEITAFRTALASSLIVCRRRTIKTVAIFGAGKQAYWHLRLTLLLRGHSIKNVHVVNRSFKAAEMVRTLHRTDGRRKADEGWSSTQFSILTPAYGEYDRVIKEQLRAADVIITTVPSTEPLFDHTILSSTEGRRKGRLIVAIGSYKPHMIEIPPELLHQAVKVQGDHRHFHRHAIEGGCVVVDTLTGCLKEAGEISAAGLTPMQLVELGELVMLEARSVAEMNGDKDATDGDATDVDLDLNKLRLDRSANSSISSVFKSGRSGSRSSSQSREDLSSGRMSRKSSRCSISDLARSSSRDAQKATGREDAMSKWLSDGNVIYKSVGFGLMDLVVGGDMVKMAQDRNIGTTIPDF